MTTQIHTRRAPSALLALFAAALIGTTPIIAAIFTSAPSAEVAR